MRQSFILLTICLVLSCSPSSDPQVQLDVSLIEVQTDRPSIELEEIIKPYRQVLDSQMNVVIGRAAIDLLNPYGERETGLGKFISNLMLEEARATFDMPIDLSLMNSRGGLRAPINAGPITVGEVYSVMPFDNEIVVLSLNADEVEEIVRHAARTKSTIWPCTYTYDGETVSKLEIRGKPLDKSQMYNIVTSDYLADGGTGYSMLVSAERLSLPTSLKLRDMIIQHIEKLEASGKEAEAPREQYITILQ